MSIHKQHQPQRQRQSDNQDLHQRCVRLAVSAHKFLYPSENVGTHYISGEEIVNQAVANGYEKFDPETDPTNIDVETVNKEIGPTKDVGVQATVQNTTREERAAELRQFGNAFERDIQLVPTIEKDPLYATQGTSIDEVIEDDDFYDIDNAARLLCDGTFDGFYLVCGREELNTEGIVLLDYDNVSRYSGEDLGNTLRIRSGSGEGFHDYFIGEFQRGARGLDTDFHVQNQGGVVPGSIHPSEGIYTVERSRPIARLKRSQLPEELRPTTSDTNDKDVRQSKFSDENLPASVVEDGQFTNEVGISLSTIRERDSDVDDLLSSLEPSSVTVDTPQGASSPTPSEYDAKLAGKLKFHRFTDTDTERIIEEYRRPSERGHGSKYVSRTVRECPVSDIANYSDWFVHDLPPKATHSDGDGNKLIDEFRDRVTNRLVKALDSDEQVLIEALPSLGKSYGTVKAAAQSEGPITVLTARHDLYDQFDDWCDEFDLTIERIPSFTHDCLTYDGEHGDEWQDKVNSAYQSGVSASRIHKSDLQLFDQRLPCQAGDEPCQFKRKWDDLNDDADVLVGHYRHAYAPKSVSDRTVVIDEYDLEAWTTEFTADSVHSIVSAYLDDNSIPERELFNAETLDDLMEIRGDYTGLLPSDVGSKNDFNHVVESNGHTDADLIVETILTAERMGNGFERAHLGEIDGNDMVGVRNRENGSVTVLKRPELDETNGIICLDGTPIHELWELALGREIDHWQALSDNERTTLLDEHGYNIIHLNDSCKPYSSGQWVTQPHDRTLMELISAYENKPLSVISSDSALDIYKENEMLENISNTEHFGNFVGSNEFEDVAVGSIFGSPSRSDEYVKRIGALANETVTAEREDTDGRNKSVDYGDFGNKIVKQYREMGVFQAIMRFGRNDGVEPNVYVNTSSLPDWVPTIRPKIADLSSSAIEVYTTLINADDGLTATEICEQTDMSDRQERRCRNTLIENELVQSRTHPEDGRKTLYSLI